VSGTTWPILPHVTRLAVLSTGVQAMVTEVPIWELPSGKGFFEWPTAMRE
jgi:hypothetical protein